MIYMIYMTASKKAYCAFPTILSYPSLDSLVISRIFITPRNYYTLNFSIQHKWLLDILAVLTSILDGIIIHCWKALDLSFLMVFLK